MKVFTYVEMSDDGLLSSGAVFAENIKTAKKKVFFHINGELQGDSLSQCKQLLASFEQTVNFKSEFPFNGIITDGFHISINLE